MHGTRHLRRQGFGGRHMSRGWSHGYGHRGHRARRGDVRSAILALLDERPMHGYEMIQDLEERTGGRWRPSAGSIYPTLQLLEDEGLVKGDDVEGKRVYSLTSDGEKAVKDSAGRGRPWEDGDEDSPRHRLRAEAIRLRGALVQLGQAGEEKQVEEAAKLLADTRKRLYEILGSD